MAVPVQFYVANLPADNPEGVQELLNTLGNSLGTEWTPSVDYIIGQMGGVLPQSNIGPWFNNGEWWFWNAAQGAYTRGYDGVPVGMMTFWGGQGTPNNWVTCDGSELSRTDYNELYQVIGVQWGGGDGVTTFNLPPGGLFYVNDGQFTPDPSVTLVAAASNNGGRRSSGWGVQGGAQVAPLLTAQNMPALNVAVKFVWTGMSAGGVAGVSNLYPASQTNIPPRNFQILDGNGTPLINQAQTQFATMPPFAAANVIIKYQ
jgi:hypothetical protein